MTDDSGLIQSPHFKDSILIRIQAIGYESYTGYLYSKKPTCILLTPKNLDLETVVVTGQYSPNYKSNSVYDVEVLTDAELEEKGATNMQEVLNSQLNFKTNNGHTNETALNINGLSGAHVKFMIDGVPVEGRVNGNVDLSQINLDNVQRIEIIEGPVSVVYGTNALGGIVNIITKKSSQQKFTPYLNTYYETVGKYNLNAGIGIRKKHTTIRLSGGRNFFAGYSDNDTSRSQIWKPREQYFSQFSLNKKLKRFNFTSTVSGFHETMISKGELNPPYYTTAFDTYSTTSRLNNYYLLNGFINKTAYLDFTLGYNFYKRERNIYFNDLAKLEKYLTDGESDQDTTVYNNFIFRSFYSKKVVPDKFSYLIGTELKQNFIKANRVQNERQNIGNYALFASLNYHPKKMVDNPTCCTLRIQYKIYCTINTISNY